MNFTTIYCPCCNVMLIIQIGIKAEGKIMKSAAVTLGIPFRECPDCGYDLTGIRFHAPPVQVQPQKPQMPNPKFGGKGGLHGLKG